MRRWVRRVSATLCPRRHVGGHPESARRAALAAVEAMPWRQRWQLFKADPATAAVLREQIERIEREWP